MMTGRPSMVKDRDCSLTLPGQETGTPSSEGASQSGESRSVSGPEKTDSFRFSTFAPTPKASQNGSIAGQIQVPLEATYFKHYVDLTNLAQEVVPQLYAPAIRQQRWSKIQAMIDSFDDRLSAWKANLKAPFGGPVDQPGQGMRISSFNIALAIQFQCIRTVINRPSLCRHERTTFKESSRTAVSRCVGSARAVIDLILNSPAAALLHQGPKWWLLLHHLKRALTVLLLELAFRAEHMPSKAEELLDEAKQAIEWLRKMASVSTTAQYIWATMRRLLHLAAKRVGFDAGDTGVVNSNDPLPWLSYPVTKDAAQPTALTLRPVISNAVSYNSGFDPIAFDNFVPYANPLQSQEQAHRILLEEQAFDEFNFEPMASGQLPFPPLPYSGYPMTIGGEQHATTSSMIPQQPHGMQHGSEVRADGYLVEDWFGFDANID